MIALLAGLAFSAEIALVLDNSCSMAVTHTDAGQPPAPANDPERAAVLGALIVEGLARGSADHLTVWAFGDAPGAPPRPLAGPDAIRAAPYVGGTWFVPPLTAAVGQLVASSHDERLLVLFTDGAPEDVQNPGSLARVLDVDGGSYGTFVVGLYGSPAARQRGEAFLGPLARDPEDLVYLDDPAAVVPAFTRAYARAIGSRALVGRLDATTTIRAPAGVTEILVSTASVDPGPAFRATLTGASAFPPVATGDDGCPADVAPKSTPEICADPRRSYAAWRVPVDPAAPHDFTLTTDRAVQYGVILRFDLVADVDVPETTGVDQPVEIAATLTQRGAPFTDPAFFARDGFRAFARVDGAEIPLTFDGSRFVGTFTPTRPSNGRPLVVEARFRSDWLDLAARDATIVEGWLPFALVADAVDLGAWRGERGRTERCAILDLGRSTNLDRVPVGCDQAPGDLELTCTPLPDSAGPTGQPTRYEVCGVARACCSAAQGPGAVVITPYDAHYRSQAVSVPVHYAVERTGWLRCWWPVLAALAAIAAAFWFVWGWISPRSFDPGLAIRVAGTEAGLRSAQGLVLRELPGGQRGFYRHARVSLTGGGDFVRRPGQAAVVIAAGRTGPEWWKHAGVERLDRRTRQWKPVEPGPVDVGAVYKAGNLWFKLG